MKFKKISVWNQIPSTISTPRGHCAPYVLLHTIGERHHTHIISHIIISGLCWLMFKFTARDSWFKAVLKPHSAVWMMRPPKEEALSTPWCLPFLSACFHKGSEDPDCLGQRDCSWGRFCILTSTPPYAVGVNRVRRHLTAVDTLHLPHPALRIDKVQGIFILASHSISNMTHNSTIAQKKTE